MENIITKLESLGLNEKEASIYLAILRLKQATIIELVKTTKIKRTTVYHLIDSLIEKGLINKFLKDDKKYYLAENPKDGLNNLISEKKETINLLVPELKNLYGSSGVQPEIKLYRNIGGIKNIFEDILNSKEKVCRYYASDFSVEEMLGEKFVDDFVKKRIKAQIKSRSIRSFKYKPKREKESSNSEQLREVRFISDEMVVKPYMCIYDDKVVVIASQEEKVGFIIQSKEYANAQKTIFDMVWAKVAM